MDPYRIKKATTFNDEIHYYPEKRFLGFWVPLDYNIFLDFLSRYDVVPFYESYEEAEFVIYEHIYDCKSTTRELRGAKQIEYLALNEYDD